MTRPPDTVIVFTTNQTNSSINGYIKDLQLMDMSKGYYDIVEHFIISEDGIFLCRNIDHRGPRFNDTNPVFLTVLSQNLSDEQRSKYFDILMDKYGIDLVWQIATVPKRVSDLGIPEFSNLNFTEATL